MSQLISSAVSGNNVAPKAPPRRRRPPPPPPAKAATPTPVPTEQPVQQDVAPPSPPPTQQPETPAPSQHAEVVASSQDVPAPAPAVPDWVEKLHPKAVARQRAAAAEQRQPQLPLPTPITTPVVTPVSERPIERLAQQPAEQPSEQPAERPVEQVTPNPQLRPPKPPPKRKARVQAPTGNAAPPAKRAKRSSARSNTTIQSEIHAEDAASQASNAQAQATPGAATARASETPAVTASSSKPKSKRQPKAAQRRPTMKSAAFIVDSDDEQAPEPEETPAIAKPAKRRKTPAKSKARRKKVPQISRPPIEAEEEGVNEDGGQSGAEGQADGTTEYQAEGQADEEGEGSDPELHEIDPNTVTMFGLSYDKKRGKTSAREKAMAEIDWDEVARKRYEEIERVAAAATAAAAAGPNAQTPPPPDVVETTEGPSGTAETAEEPEPEPEAPVDENAGPTFGIDEAGDIVVDETNLVINRQALVEAEARQIDVTVHEANDLTRRVNQMTWVNARRRDPAERVPHSRGKSDPWSEEETERFYEALRMFGSDFFLISKMFHPKTRKMIKLKFIREERIDLQRVNAALMGKQTGPTYDLEFYARETGREVSEFTKFEDMAHADRVIAEEMEVRRADLIEEVRARQDDLESGEAALAIKEKNREKAKERKAAKAKERAEERAKEGGEKVEKIKKPRKSKKKRDGEAVEAAPGEGGGGEGAEGADVAAGTEGAGEGAEVAVGGAEEG